MKLETDTQFGQVQIQAYDDSVSDQASPNFIVYVQDLYTCQPKWETIPPEGIEPLTINGVQVAGAIGLKVWTDCDLSDPSLWKISHISLRRLGTYNDATDNATSKFRTMAVTLAAQLFTAEFKHQVEVESKENQVTRLTKAVETAREKLSQALKNSTQARAELEILRGISEDNDILPNCLCDNYIKEGLVR
jgi:hypothetical protein